MKNIFIYGTGGHAKVAHDIIAQCTNKFHLLGFIDTYKSQDTFLGHPVWNKKELSSSENYSLFVAIGSNFKRKTVIDELNSEFENIDYQNIIHPSAIVSPNATLGCGNFIGPASIVNAGTIIQNHCIINTGAQLDHDCLLANYASLAPGSVLGGNVSVGELTAIGLNAAVIHGINISNNVVIGAGSLVLKNIEELTVNYGVPSKVIRTRIPSDGYL